jgi:hypothetical protein
MHSRAELSIICFWVVVVMFACAYIARAFADYRRKSTSTPKQRIAVGDELWVRYPYRYQRARVVAILKNIDMKITISFVLHAKNVPGGWYGPFFMNVDDFKKNASTDDLTVELPTITI